MLFDLGTNGASVMLAFEGLAGIRLPLSPDCVLPHSLWKVIIKPRMTFYVYVLAFYQFCITCLYPSRLGIIPPWLWLMILTRPFRLNDIMLLLRQETKWNERSDYPILGSSG